jgi:hypothetical protein
MVIQTLQLRFQVTHPVKVFLLVGVCALLRLDQNLCFQDKYCERLIVFPWLEWRFGVMMGLGEEAAGFGFCFFEGLFFFLLVLIVTAVVIAGNGVAGGSVVSRPYPCIVP